MESFGVLNVLSMNLVAEGDSGYAISFVQVTIFFARPRNCEVPVTVTFAENVESKHLAHFFLNNLLSSPSLDLKDHGYGLPARFCREKPTRQHVLLLVWRSLAF